MHQAFTSPEVMTLTSHAHFGASGRNVAVAGISRCAIARTRCTCAALVLSTFFACAFLISCWYASCALLLTSASDRNMVCLRSTPTVPGWVVCTVWHATSPSRQPRRPPQANKDLIFKMSPPKIGLRPALDGARGGLFTVSPPRYLPLCPSTLRLPRILTHRGTKGICPSASLLQWHPHIFALELVELPLAAALAAHAIAERERAAPGREEAHVLEPGAGRRVAGFHAREHRLAGEPAVERELGVLPCLAGDSTLRVRRAETAAVDPFRQRD